MRPDATTLLLHESDCSVISPWKKPIVTRSNKEQKENNSFCILPSRLRSTSPKAPRTSVQRTFLNDTSTFDLIAHSKKLCVYVEVTVEDADRCKTYGHFCKFSPSTLHRLYGSCVTKERLRMGA